MRNKMTILTVTALVISTGIAGCASTPVEGKTYSSIDDLRNDFEAAGGNCPDWVQTDQVSKALQSGKCDLSTVLAIYESSQDISNQVSELKKGMEGTGLELQFLVGPNWIVNSPDYKKVQQLLGGKTLD